MSSDLGMPYGSAGLSVVDMEMTLDSDRMVPTTDPDIDIDIEVASNNAEDHDQDYVLEDFRSEAIAPSPWDVEQTQDSVMLEGSAEIMDEDAEYQIEGDRYAPEQLSPIFAPGELDIDSIQTDENALQLGAKKTASPTVSNHSLTKGSVLSPLEALDNHQSYYSEDQDTARGINFASEHPECTGSQDSLHQNRNSGSKPYSPLHPVKVYYEETEMSLFPPSTEEASETFFLEDESLAFENMSEVFSAMRAVLADSIREVDELQLEVDSLSLYLGEDSISSRSTTLSQLLDLHIQLSRHDGVKHVAPLNLTLFVKTGVRGKLRYLTNALAEGKGISQLHRWDDDHALYSEDEHAGVEGESDRTLEATDGAPGPNEDDYYIDDAEEEKENNKQDSSHESAAIADIEEPSTVARICTDTSATDSLGTNYAPVNPTKCRPSPLSAIKYLAGLEVDAAEVTSKAGRHVEPVQKHKDDNTIDDGDAIYYEDSEDENDDANEQLKSSTQTPATNQTIAPARKVLSKVDHEGLTAESSAGVIFDQVQDQVSLHGHSGDEYSHDGQEQWGENETTSPTLANNSVSRGDAEELDPPTPSLSQAEENSMSDEHGDESTNTIIATKDEPRSLEPHTSATLEADKDFEIEIPLTSEELEENEYTDQHDDCAEKSTTFPILDHSSDANHKASEERVYSDEVNGFIRDNGVDTASPSISITSTIASGELEPIGQTINPTWDDAISQTRGSLSGEKDDSEGCYEDYNGGEVLHGSKFADAEEDINPTTNVPKLERDPFPPERHQTEEHEDFAKEAIDSLASSPRRHDFDLDITIAPVLDSDGLEPGEVADFDDFDTNLDVDCRPTEFDTSTPLDRSYSKRPRVEDDHHASNQPSGQGAKRIRSK